MSERTSVNSMFHIDTSEVRRKIYYGYGRPAVDILTREMRFTFPLIGKHCQRFANELIKGGASSRLAKASKVTTREYATRIETVVDWNDARSDSGFPYAAAVNTGRKAFGPIIAKALRFEIEGKVIFAQWVKAFPGVHFTTRGLSAARPTIDGEVRQMKVRITRQLQSLARA